MIGNVWGKKNIIVEMEPVTMIVKVVLKIVGNVLLLSVLLAIL